MRVIRRWTNALGVYGIPLLVVVWLCARVLLGVNPPFVATESSAMEPTVRSGDLVVLHDVDVGDVTVGDVVAVHDDEDAVILRRVVTRDQQGSSFAYGLRADNRPTTERGTVSDDDIVGRGGAQLPLLGWFVLVARSTEGAVALVVAWVVAVALRVTRRPDGALPYRGADRAEGPDATKMGSAMSITPAELRHLRFAQVRRGYDTEAVDRALESVADSVEQLQHERAALLERLRVLEADVARMRENEEAITHTLQLAERAAEELKAEAKVEADRLLEHARQQAAGATGPSALPDPAFVELLGETRAIRSLLQTLLTQGGGESPFTPRKQ